MGTKKLARLYVGVCNAAKIGQNWGDGGGAATYFPRSFHI